jgi:hypothetical protein
MITSAREFFELRTSVLSEDYLRAANDGASLEVWFDVPLQYPNMKVWVAHNKTVPLEILERLALDPDPRVRYAVAVKNKLTHELMLTLARDGDPSVRQGIVNNKNTCGDLLRLLALDPDMSISVKARERLSSRKA